MKTEARAIEDLQLDDRCQTRVETDHDAIESYAEAYADDVTLPPVEAVEVAGALYVVDGFHRIAAASKAGHEFIRDLARGDDRTRGDPHETMRWSGPSERNAP